MIKDSLFMKTIRGERCSRPPVWFMRQAGRVLPSYQKLKEKHHFSEMMEDPEMAADVTLLPIDDLGVDAAILFSDILVIPKALGMEPDFTDGGPMFSNPLAGPANKPQELNADSSRLDYIYAAIDAILRKRPADIPLTGFCGGPFTVFCYMVQGRSQKHDFPEAIKYLYNNKKDSRYIFEAIAEMSVEYAQKQIQHGIDAFQLFETHAGLIPSDVYHDMIMPHVATIADSVRGKVPFIFFPKGLGAGLKQIPDGFADFVSIDWQMPMTMAKELLPPGTGLQGNLDPRILYADQKTIEEAIKSYTPFAKSQNKWIFNLGHGLLPDIPYENVKFAVETIKNTDWGR